MSKKKEVKEEVNIISREEKLRQQNIIIQEWATLYEKATHIVKTASPRQYADLFLSMLKSNNVNGVMYVQGIGTITMFNDDSSKIIVLEEAKKELRLRKQQEKMETFQMLEHQRITNNYNNIMPSYIG
jgi:hypothetical protein